MKKLPFYASLVVFILFVTAFVYLRFENDQKANPPESKEVKLDKFSKMEGLGEWVKKAVLSQHKEEKILCVFIGYYGCGVHDLLEIVNVAAQDKIEPILVFYPAYQDHDINNLKERLSIENKMYILPDTFKSEWDEIAGKEKVQSGYALVFDRQGKVTSSVFIKEGFDFHNYVKSFN